jgi:hypothetical protein
MKRRQTKEVEKPRQLAATAPFACTACVQQHVIHEDAVQNKDVQVNNPEQSAASERNYNQYQANCRSNVYKQVITH